MNKDTYYDYIVKCYMVKFNDKEDPRINRRRKLVNLFPNVNNILVSLGGKKMLLREYLERGFKAENNYVEILAKKETKPIMIRKTKKTNSISAYFEIPFEEIITEKPEKTTFQAYKPKKFDHEWGEKKDTYGKKNIDICKNLGTIIDSIVPKKEINDYKSKKLQRQL